MKALKDIRDDSSEPSDIPRIEEPRESSKKDVRAKKVLRVDMNFERERIQRGIEEDKRGRKKLLVLEAKVGNAVMDGIVDSGSSANIISARKAAEMGLPIERLDEDSFPVTGLKGPPIGCNYMIPNAVIYVSEKKYPTYGDLYIVDGITVDLLYGRPWIVDNYAGIQEKPLGTYVSWVLESVHTILTQPGTPVSFRGMCITCYSISGNSGISDVFHFRKTPELRRFHFPETPDSDVFRY